MNPSLLLIPDRYKAAKLYSQIPDSGAGDLAFTRANDTATRVNSAGLIEKVRTNLWFFSQQFDNAQWLKSNVNITANAAVAPDGTTTADKMVDTTANDEHRIRATDAQFTVTTSTTFSIFAKASEYTKFAIADLSNSTYVKYNLTAGSVISTGAGFSNAKIEDFGNGWYRLSAVVNANATYGYGLLNASDDFIFTGTGTSGVFIWGAQAETGDIATPYIPTTTAAVSVGMLADIPRIDYTGGGCGKLLLEPQRTNLIAFSEQFDNASWTKGGTTISTNTSATLDPSGFNGADKLVEDSSTGVHRVFNNSSVTISDSTATTYSVFAKAAERTQIFLRDNDIVGARFNLSTGAVISTEGTATATITNYGNGWYRCTITRISSTTAGRVIVYLDNGGDSYTGNGTSGVYIWGAQVE